MLLYKNDQFTTMEQVAIQAICLEQPPVIAKRLLAQFKAASFKVRNMTGLGFFTYIHVPQDVEPVDDTLHMLGNLRMKIDTLQHGCGFILFIKNGYLNVLECFTYNNENWPATIAHFEIVNA